MILTVDIGNSNIMLGGFDGDKLSFVVTLSTEADKTADEYASKIMSVLAVRGIECGSLEGAIVSSVVPTLNPVVKEAIRIIWGIDSLTVGPGVKTGLGIRCDMPSSVGADLICASVACHNLYGSPSLIVDLGTATKMTLVNENGAFCGVSIMPGVMMGLNSLAENTAQLPKVELDVPRSVIGKNTADSMRSGIVLGNASMIDGMIDRINEEVGCVLPVYATGGFAGLIVPHCKHDVTVDEYLVLKGLNLIYRKNV